MERTECSFIKDGKEWKERNVLFLRTEKNGKNVTFFWKERMPNPVFSFTVEFWSSSFQNDFLDFAFMILVAFLRFKFGGFCRLFFNHFSFSLILKGFNTGQECFLGKYLLEPIEYFTVFYPHEQCLMLQLKNTFIVRDAGIEPRYRGLSSCLHHVFEQYSLEGYPISNIQVN